ncbi:MAG: signal peptidase II [Holophaga sp.]|nr:signal peptidase II [Holophaga sp.]
MKRRLFWLMVPAVALFLDWSSKQWILAHLKPGEHLTVIPGFFNLTLGFNSGAIFGVLASAPSGFRNGLFLIAGLAALGYFGYEFLKEGTPTLQRVALGLILGGAMGNGLDRIVHGAVVDFLDFIFFGWNYWTFNIADSCIVCGAILMGLSLILSRPNPDKVSAPKAS